MKNIKSNSFRADRIDRLPDAGQNIAEPLAWKLKQRLINNNSSND